MPRHPLRICCCLNLLLLLAGGCGPGDDSAYRAEIDAWHAGRIASLRSEEGWLTLIGLHPLGQGENTLGAARDNDLVLASSLPDHLGVLNLLGGRVEFRAAPGAKLYRVHEGSPAESPFVKGILRSDGQGSPDKLSCGSVVFYVIQRGEKYFLRVKDSQAQTRLAFTDINRYPVDRKWRVTAALEGEPGTMRVANVLGQVAPEPTPGTLVFRLRGQTCRLRPTGRRGEEMFVVFGDATNGRGTYSGGRFLVVEPPDEKGSITLDFNRAYNPPCVFSAYATCPLPVLDNILPVAVIAGEKMWGPGH